MPSVHAAEDFHLVHGLDAHAQVALDKGGVDDGAADAHADGADLQVALAAHGGHGDGGPAEPQELLPDVGGDIGDLVQVLDVMAVDAEGGQALLGVGGQHRGQIHRAGALGAVEAPDALDGHGIDVHGLGAVAPAGGDGEGDIHAGLFELVGAGGAFRHTADGGIGDDDLDGLAVGVAEIFLKELLGGLGHGHGLILQGFPDLQRAAAAVDDGANTDDRVVADVAVGCHSCFLLVPAADRGLQYKVESAISQTPGRLETNYSTSRFFRRVQRGGPSKPESRSRRYCPASMPISSSGCMTTGREGVIMEKISSQS